MFARTVIRRLPVVQRRSYSGGQGPDRELVTICFLGGAISGAICGIENVYETKKIRYDDFNENNHHVKKVLDINFIGRSLMGIFGFTVLGGISGIGVAYGWKIIIPVAIGASIAIKYSKNPR